MDDDSKISTREELIEVLHEAAEIEHGLLVQYLFAALSLKQSPEEGLTAEQFSRLRTWKGVILGVAVDEMGHLGTVCNLLAAIGAPPHFGRPAFPQTTGYYPFPLELIPFGELALERFVRAELPRQGSLLDCLGTERLERDVTAGEDSALEVPPYEYVGELYCHISKALLAIPEQQLFIGSPTRQVDNNWSVNVDMRVISDRTSALLAIEDLVRDGEGTPTTRADSHYGRFCAMLRDFRRDPFLATRPISRNPRTRPHRSRPGAEEDPSLITEPVALAVAKVFNGVYSLMLRLLAQFFSNSGESSVQREALRGAAARLMSIGLRPLAEVLTALPAKPGGTDNAGPPFELYLPVIVPPETKTRWPLLFESFDQIIAATCSLTSVGSPALARLGPIADTLGIMKRSLQVAARSSG